MHEKERPRARERERETALALHCARARDSDVCCGRASPATGREEAETLSFRQALSWQGWTPFGPAECLGEHGGSDVRR